MARAAIYNRKLYTIRALARGDHRRKLLGILTIHLPLITAPDLAAIPNTEFIFSVEDKLEHCHTKGRVGPYDQAVEYIRLQGLTWENKEDQGQLVWNGKLSLAPKLRRTLLEVARAYPWVDVKEVQLANKANFFGMEDHCDYRFITHVKCRFYSALLKPDLSINIINISTSPLDHITTTSRLNEVSRTYRRRYR
ncbi:uncharacterized protein ATNIH1004_006887 [Aspergillus tanneri]|uniref:Uncharacterized protein n=1 Tax=Aspergillus tanneri TaxID=1220188 RepID=A0A5M9MER6_9EURO|nr:uncharacterized protein ATNIH1004_006887 [Aspergillus tanneri]KAA8645468.1 hypothetical protein ATNIH1004_006887 [Aspergillus tanneri]